MAIECADVLRQGVFNELNLSTYESVKSDYLDYLNSLDEQSARKADARGVDLSLPVEGVPVSFGADSSAEEWQTWKSTLTTLKESNFSRRFISDRFERVAAPELISAWKECMIASMQVEAKRSGLVVTIVRFDGGFVLNILFSLPGKPIAINLKGLEVVNGIIEGEVPPTFDSNDGIVLKCSFLNPEKDATVLLDTDRGEWIETIPAVRTPPAKKKVSRTAGGDFMAQASVTVSVFIPFDQTVVVWGGRVVAWGGPNSVASCFVQQITPPDHQLLVARDSVYIGSAPNPEVRLNGMGPFFGYQVGPFYRQITVNKGPLAFRLWGGENNGAVLVNSVLCIEFQAEE